MTKWNAVALILNSLSHSCSFVWDFLLEVYIIYRWYNQWTLRIDISRRWCEMISIIINWTDKQTVRKLSVTQVCFSSDSCRRGDECKKYRVSVWSELETWHVMPSVPHISHILHSKLRVHSTGNFYRLEIFFEIFTLYFF